jgi:BirA family biotin operon repressor/biotin-[acetyl-CoA-carboxylase] ligase
VPTAGALLGRPRVHHRVLGSTNDRARALAAAGAPHGTLVTATAQSAGRGRQGRTWVAPPGRALTCSLVVRGPGPLLPLAAGVAVAEVAGPSARIKWPNDVLLDARKVAGILVEGRPQEGWAVLGIGVNVAVSPDELPPELRERAGTLGRDPAALETVLGELLGALERWLPAGGEDVLAAVRARDALRGHPIRWAGGTGTATGIDDAGRLLVTRSAGEVLALDAGEVHLLPS